VASPKHADALVVSGPVSPGMSGPLRTAWDCLPAPRALIACGTEATSGGLFARGEWPAEPDLWIAGDPPRPDTVLAAFRLLLGRSRYSFRAALQARLRHLRERGNAREESR
jgi:Ni,Fe-hydrogenase III small subunit